MPNKAAQELESLLALQNDAADDVSNAAKLREARHDFIMQGQDEADFAWPEGIATAVAAGWVLGPVGGLLMGLAQGILGKQEQQAAIDEYLADTGAMRETSKVFYDQIDRLALTATNDNDLEQLSAMQTEFDAAMQMMASASPELQSQGAQMLSAANDRLNQYTVRQEEQRITAEAADAQLKRDLDDQQYTRFKAMNDDFRAESAGYEDVMRATQDALTALENGTPSDLWAAGILINKALDPTGVVRQEEAEAVGALGSIWDKANVFMEKARSGQTMLPEQRQELMGLLMNIRGNASEYQLAREARYADMADDAELPAKYRDNFRIVSSVPASVPGPLKNVATAPTEDIERAARDAIFPYTDEGIKLNAKYAWGNFTNWLGIGKDSPPPRSLEEMAETNPRVKRALEQ